MLHMSILPPSPGATPRTAGRLPAAPRAMLADHRAEALRHTAPWLSGLSLGCALVILWAIGRGTAWPWLAGWSALIVALNIVIFRARRSAAGYGDVGPLRSTWWCVAEAAVHAGLWGMLPATVFAGQPPGTQVVLAGATGTMMAGAFLLAIVPLAAAMWALVIAGSLLWALQAEGGTALASGAVLLTIYSVVVITGCLTVERLLARQAGDARDERVRGEAIARLLREYEDQGAGWLWQTDAHHQLTYASPHICDRLGQSTGQLIGQSLPIVFGDDAVLAQALATREAFSGVEIVLPTPAGECWLALSGSPIISGSGTFDGFRGLGIDLTESRRAQERIRRVALIDDLTGLPNRQQIRCLLGEAIEAADRTGRSCALLFADLDGFKPVNDRFGHPVGDTVLRIVARRLAAIVGDAGHVGRLGGDEFAIILGAVEDRQQVMELGNRLIAAIAEPVAFDRGEVRVGLSFGCVFAPAHGNTVDDLLIKADIALYQAKSAGRGRMMLFDPSMEWDADERAALEQDLKQALARSELRLDYQPVIDVATQAIVGFEALLRWAHPQRGLVPPLIFLPIAEECGLIGEIGEWVIRTACADAAVWPDDIFVAVNLSRAQLLVPDLAAVVGDALLAARLQPARLELDVTESVFQGESDAPLDVLRRLRAIGVGIALDDFGSGYSSLGYLNRTIFHTLKLDGSFVRNAAGAGETLAVIRAIVALATSFRMVVTAEGVESFEDFARMKALGCQRVQGYLFGRPAPAADAAALLAPRPKLPAAPPIMPKFGLG